MKATLLVFDAANIKKVPVPGITEDKYFLRRQCSGQQRCKIPVFPRGYFIPATPLQTNTGANYLHFNEPHYTAKYFGSCAPANVRSKCWTDRIDNTYVTWPDTIRPEPLIKNESRMRQEGDVKKYRVKDYLDFLANVKNIPVGIRPPI